MADITTEKGNLPLGVNTEYVSVYTPSLLCAISRQQSRVSLGIESETLPFKGIDIWNAYEISWLDSKGKPLVAIGEFRFPCANPSMIESKSLKLYLNSFNQTRFNSTHEVIKTLESDLATTCKGPVSVRLLLLRQAAQRGIGYFTGDSLDHLMVDIEHYAPNPRLLSIDRPDHIVAEALCSDLLKTNCPVTGQPDWGSVLIQYRGQAINREGLLKYIISLRECRDFHEHCVERIYMDIIEQCSPDELTVYARYTRRGGVDINVFRSNVGEEPLDIRLVRQ